MRLRATRLAGLGYPGAGPSTPPGPPPVPGATLATEGNPHWDKVVALLPFDGEDDSTTIIDLSSYAHTPVVEGGAKITTGLKKFGSGSLLADGVGGVKVPSHPAFAIPGDFTIEGWFRQDQPAGTQNLLTFGSGRNLYIVGGQLQLWTGASGVVVMTLPEVAVWYHIAVARQGGTTRVFVNGELKLTTAAISGALAASDFLVGAYPSSPYFDGRIDDVCFVNGAALYTENFTVPSGAISAAGDTLVTETGDELAME